MTPSELGPYWPTRIQHDRIWTGQYIYEGARFYAPNQYTDSAPHVYEIANIRHDGDVFDMWPCATATSPTDGISRPVTESAHVDNVCGLAGALEAGELIHLPAETLKTIESSSYLTMGQTTLEIPSDVQAGRPLESLDPPNGPASQDIAHFIDTLDLPDGLEPTFYIPHEVEPPTGGLATSQDSAASDGIRTGYTQVQRFSKWTFDDQTIREWVERAFQPGDRILNATAGKTKLNSPPDAEVLRNDANPERDADTHIDVAELATVYDADSFDVIVFDPPWSLYQSNLRYDGYSVNKSVDGYRTEIDLTKLPFETPSPEEKSQLGHARLAKENFDWILKPGGLVIQLTFHGTAMPARLNYERVERHIFDPIGEGKAVIGSIDQKTGNKAIGASCPSSTLREATDQDSQQRLSDF